MVSTAYRAGRVPPGRPPRRRLRTRSVRRRQQRRRIAGIAVLLVALGIGVAVLRPSVLPFTGCTATGGTATLTSEQAANAATIAAVGNKLGLPDHAVTIALATAMQESKLRNLDYGDLDSLGLFQQRPSQGWGTAAEIQDPVYASTAFYQRLEKVDSWQTMSVTEAAQTVQHSGAPDAYAAHETEARALARALTGEVSAGLTCTATSTAAHGATAATITADAQRVFGTNPFAGAVPPTRGWAAATWAVAHADSYRLRAVTFDGQRWTPGSGKWVRDPQATSRIGLELSP